MKVKLFNYTPNPDMTVASAARQCYSPDFIDRITSELENKDYGEFIQKLFNLGHFSPFEHVSFTFAISGVSRALTHQLVRHRIASYSQKSQRYVSENKFEYIIPPSIEKNHEAYIEYTKTIEDIQRKYDKLINLGIPKEDARFVLPNACETKILVTMNARALMNFFEHRCCTRAQWEIREMANKMLAEVKKVAPNIFNHAGAACMSLGYCPEGKMSCGRVPTLDDIKNNVKQ